MAPRGIVAAAVSSIFSLELVEAGYPEAAQLASLTFLVIVGTVLIYGLGASPLARHLGVSQQNPQGILIVGAHPLARSMAQALREEKYQVLMVDTNWSNVTAARLDGLPAYYGSIVSEEIMNDLDFGGIGRLLALTSNDEANSLAALHFVEIFGRAEVYQLPPTSGRGKNGEELWAQHLRGRFLFGPGMTYGHLTKQFAAGARVKITTLTREFNYAAFQNLYGQEAIPLFLITETRQLLVFTAEEKLTPQPGQTLISLATAKAVQLS